MSQGTAQQTPPEQTSGSAADSVPRLLQHVDAVRQSRERECVSLLQELTPHLHAARMVERELDRHLARRFNVFRYLRRDELGLSRIIAELLDPAAEHGQGTNFLEAMLELLGVAPEPSDSGRSGDAVSGGRNRAATWKRRFGRLRSTTTDTIRVVRERGIARRRRIDITVDIPTDDGPFCLAFENKPYDGDQPDQCSDYLKFLEKQYGGRCLLVYLPPRYRMPDESSLSAAERERWKNHFRVLPYVADDMPPGDDDPPDEDGAAPAQIDSGEDDDAFSEDDAADQDSTAAQDHAAVGDGASLADWFGTCCKLSDSERLRWFLREAQLYCQHHFGASTMTDTEAAYIYDYLDKNPKHLQAAFAVSRAWSGVREEVYRRFLERLRDRVEERLLAEMPDTREDLQVGCHYEGASQSVLNVLWITRTGWMEYVDAPERARVSRTSILFQSHRKGMNNWRWGVRSPKPQGQMTKAESERRMELESRLRHYSLWLGQTSDWWPQYAAPRYEHWDPLIPELGIECSGDGSKITDYYVNGLLKIAEKAIPAIDQVELE